MSKKLLSTGVAAVVAAMGMGVASVDAAEIVANAAVANMYLWRGQDLGLGEGTPAVSGDLSVSESGFSAGAWGSSGDSAAGTEYDLWAGYGGAAGEFKYNLTFWTYVYPSAGNGDSDGPTSDDTDNIGDLSEAVLTLGYGPVSFSYYDVLAGNYDYSYYTLGATYDAFSATLGYALTKDGAGDDDSDYMHLDVSYAYNSNLSFTLSQVVDESDDDPVDDDLKFVVKYAIPLK